MFQFSGLVTYVTLNIQRPGDVNNFKVFYLSALWMKKTWGYDVSVSHPAACKILIWTLNWCASLSSWLVLTLTVQRAMSVVWPHKVNVICTRRRSFITVVVLSSVFALLYSHLLFGFDVVAVGDNGSFRLCTSGSAWYREFWGRVWTRIDLFLYSVIPAVTLVLGNGILAFTLAAAVRKASHTLASGAQSLTLGDRKRNVSSTTVTVMAVSMAFLCFSMPIMIFISVIFIPDYTDTETQSLYSFLHGMLFLLAFCNFAVNFYLYCLTGSRFRQQFKTMVCGWRGETRDKHAAHSKETAVSSVPVSDTSREWQAEWSPRFTVFGLYNSDSREAGLHMWFRAKASQGGVGWGFFYILSNIEVV